MFEKFFNKPEEEKPVPKLLGEDFDIFPDATGEYSYASEKNAEDDEPVDNSPVELTDFQQKLADMPEEQWKKYQLLAGIPAGILSGLSISFFGFLSDFFLSWGLLIAAALALLLPNLFEKRGLRKLPLYRRCALIGIVSVFVLYLLYIYVINPDAINTLNAVSAS